MPQTTSSRVVRFGAYEADLDGGELRKNGIRIKLQKQSFDLLAILLERPGEVVPRDELRQKLWPADTFVDFDNSLNAAVSKIRQALGDSAENPRYLETMARRGYRFMAPVERATEAVLATQASVEEAAPVQAASVRARSISTVAIAIVAVAFAAAAITWIKPWARQSSPAAGSSVRSLAVLPLHNLSGNPDQEYFADGITYALISELAQIAELRVTSLTSSLQYKNSSKPLPQIAKELGVDGLIEGSVLRSGSRVRIAAQLIEAATDRHLWAGSYERDLGDVLALQRDVAGDVVREIRVRLTPQETVRLARNRSVNAQAYEAYLRARAHAGLENEEDNRASIALLESSTRSDPAFAPAHAALAMAYGMRTLEFDPDDRQWEERAVASVQRALALDPDLAEAYLARGYVLWSRSNHFPHEKAIQEYRRALSLNPNLAEARHYLANIYNHIGLLDRATEEIQKAVALDPLNTGARFRVGINLLYQGKYEESLSAIRDSRRFFPLLWTFQTSYALFHLGRKQDAAERVSAFLRENPQDRGGLLHAMQALIAAAAGDSRGAQDGIAFALRSDVGLQHFHHAAYILSSTYALMNEPGPAIKYLRQAADEGFPCYPLFERDSNFKNLRQSPGFSEFMAQQKKQWERFRATL